VVKAKGLNLIRRILIQRLGSKTTRLTGKDGLTGGSNAIWAADRRSGGSGLAQARQRRGAAGSDAGHGGASAMSGGATTLMSWGAPNAAGIAPGRPAAHDEHHGDL
jgi:hypothetical protein